MIIDCLILKSVECHLHALMCSVSVVTVVFIHTMEDDQRLNTLVHEGDTALFTSALQDDRRSIYSQLVLLYLFITGCSMTVRLTPAVYKYLTGDEDEYNRLQNVLGDLMKENTTLARYGHSIRLRATVSKYLWFCDFTKLQKSLIFSLCAGASIMCWSVMIRIS